MKYTLLGASALALAAASANAAGLDRSGQSVAAIFAGDNIGNLSFGYVMPDVTGKDSGGAGGSYDDSVGKDYGVLGLSYTNSVGPKFDYAVIFDQPYGADIFYDADPTASNLGGTGADLNSQALTFVGKYNFSDRLSVFAGVKAERVDATVDLNGVAYRNAITVAAVARGAGVSPDVLGAAVQGDAAAQAALGAAFPALAGAVGAQSAAFVANGGYAFEMDADTQPGYLIGAAYEIPSIALRIAGTYHFEIEHTADTTESVFGTTQSGEVDYKTPASFNLEFQTGIAADTLLLAGYRWTDFSAVDVVPDLLGSDLVNLDDGERYTLGLGRRFSDALSGSATILYEPKGDELVSPLGPTNGLFGISIGGQFAEGPYKLSGGVNYSWLGDAKPEVAGNAVAEFENNHSVAVGFRAEMTF